MEEVEIADEVGEVQIVDVDVDVAEVVVATRKAGTMAIRMLPNPSE